jgi:hypothetical protein
MRFGTLAAIVALGAAAARPAGQSPAFQPVTDAMLERPDPGDWLHSRRTLGVVHAINAAGTCCGSTHMPSSAIPT